MALGFPIIADTNFIKLGIIDDFASFIWTSRYYDAGDFELTVAVTENAAAWLKMGNYIMHSGDQTNIGIIESIEADITEEQSYRIIAKGRFLPSILSRRIIAQQTQVTGPLADGVYALINEAIIEPVIEARRIDDFVIERSYEGEEQVDAQYTGKNLLNIISDICLLNHVGFNVKRENDQFIFYLYKGTDRSYAQDENPHVIFSDRFGNLLSAQLLEDMTKKVTDVLVAGEGEGLDRKVVWVSNDEEPTGLNRFEKYSDSRNIRSNDGAVNDAQYMEQLMEQGKEELTEYTSAFSGVVDFQNVAYGRDIFLGDVCTVENSRLGAYVNARLVEVIESVNESGVYSILPTFGS